MAHSSSEKSISAEERTDRFRKISEAWYVLSKTELRSQYDSSRIRLGKMDRGHAVHNSDMPIEIPTSYNTQRDSFNIAARKAGTDWKKNRDKYKDEMWHKLSVADKKVRKKILTFMVHFNDLTANCVYRSCIC